MKKNIDRLPKHWGKIIILFIFMCVGVWNIYKPLPDGFDKEWEARKILASDIKFITDTTYVNEYGEKQSNQNIFNEVISMVRNAHSYILVDMFLWNDFGSKNSGVYRKLSQELASEIIAKKKSDPSIIIQVISDPINTSYYANSLPFFEAMEKEGIDVTYTNLPSLRDSNPLFSTLWRIFVFPFDSAHLYFFNTTYTFRVFPNIINGGGERVTLRSLLSLLNFKANHRKLIVTDNVDASSTVYFTSLVTSANPHDGSSSHSNVAIKVRGAIADDIIRSEKAVVDLSGKNFILPKIMPTENIQGDVMVELITDSAIRDKVVDVLRKTKNGDSVDILMFYFSDSIIMEELINASNRGVSIRLILDPNKDAFGRKKNGIPNREMADSLVKKSGSIIKIRWCDTHGEQCHGKMLLVNLEKEKFLFLGSANYTRRNIGGYNLETNVALSGEYTYPAWVEANNYFEDLWSNGNYKFSANYEQYKDESRVKKIISWIMEHTGLGTF